MMNSIESMECHPGWRLIEQYKIIEIRSLSDKSKSKEYPKGSVAESHTSASSEVYFLTL